MPLPPPPAASGTYRRFVASLSIDYEKWREGTGYDLEALAALPAHEQRRAERLLIERGLRNWRDVDALAQLALASASPRALAALRDALQHGPVPVRMRVVRRCPQLADAATRTASLLRALREGEPMQGLSEALDEAVAWHPTPVIHALWQALRERDARVAPTVAALLLHLHGLARQRLALEHRPFVLRFATDDPAACAAAIAALRARIGDPDFSSNPQAT
ncbi:MAG: hypothetical protein QM788_14135 [Roseateles sp.]|uniref:hypothetical protein n=1 Tax=Roseateles sp. TaxID=1971397 RepID=UPI0039ED9159